MKSKDTVYYRFSQLIGWLLGARVFVLSFFIFALYVSSFFLFYQEESLRKAVFEIKIHGIIFCSVLSIAAGGIINTFYDWEKDRLQKPFRSRLQSFLKQKYFLYSYVLLNTVSLGVAYLLSFRIFLFFLLYHFFIWFYSHKISRILIINNLFYVSLSLYPFFGILVYYKHFSEKLFWMASYLFILLLIVDMMKDLLTIRVDKFFIYNTLPNILGIKFTMKIITSLLLVCSGISYKITKILDIGFFLSMYYKASILVFSVLGFIFVFSKYYGIIWQMNFLRFWIFLGVVFMLLDGVNHKLSII